MKNKLLLVLLVVLLNISTKSFGQRRGPHGRHPHRGHGKVVVRRSPYRPHKIVVYHPVWRPAYGYNRRWVFFPKYNLYWDNWRNHYYFYNGNAWISQPTAPPVIVNVNLEKEKHYELKESDDDKDAINEENESHRTEYKPE
jgi:hypothetical protein